MSLHDVVLFGTSCSLYNHIQVDIALLVLGPACPYDAHCALVLGDDQVGCEGWRAVLTRLRKIRCFGCTPKYTRVLACTGFHAVCGFRPLSLLIANYQYVTCHV